MLFCEILSISTEFRNTDRYVPDDSGFFSDDTGFNSSTDCEGEDTSLVNTDEEDVNFVVHNEKTRFVSCKKQVEEAPAKTKPREIDIILQKKTDHYFQVCKTIDPFIVDFDDLVQLLVSCASPAVHLSIAGQLVESAVIILSRMVDSTHAFILNVANSSHLSTKKSRRIIEDANDMNDDDTPLSQESGYASQQSELSSASSNIPSFTRGSRKRNCITEDRNITESYCDNPTHVLSRKRLLHCCFNGLASGAALDCEIDFQGFYRTSTDFNSIGPSTGDANQNSTQADSNSNVDTVHHMRNMIRYSEPRMVIEMRSLFFLSVADMKIHDPSLQPIVSETSDGLDIVPIDLSTQNIHSSCHNEDNNSLEYNENLQPTLLKNENGGTILVQKLIVKRKPKDMQNSRKKRPLEMLNRTTNGISTLSGSIDSELPSECKRACLELDTSEPHINDSGDSLGRGLPLVTRHSDPDINAFWLIDHDDRTDDLGRSILDGSLEVPNLLCGASTLMRERNHSSFVNMKNLVTTVEDFVVQEVQQRDVQFEEILVKSGLNVMGAETGRLTSQKKNVTVHMAFIALLHSAAQNSLYLLPEGDSLKVTTRCPDDVQSSFLRT